MPKLPLEKLMRLRKKFPKKHTKERIIEAENLRQLRKKDRSFWSIINFLSYRTSGGLKYYKGLLGIDLVKLTKEKLRQKEKVSFLDVGAGRGRVSSQLKKQFGNKIITSSISLTRPKLANKKIEGTDLKAIDNVHIGRIETYKKLGKYDIIVSACGILWSTDVINAIKKVYNSLSYDGIAALNVDAVQLKELRTFLQKKKIRFYSALKMRSVGIIQIEKKQNSNVYYL